jgi:hypothetical protein
VDLNYLYHRQQVSQFMADNAPSEPARRAHRAMADAYWSRIATAKNSLRPAEAA